MNIYLTIFLSSLALSGCFSSPTDKNGDNQIELQMLWEYAYDLDGGAPRVIPVIIDDLYIVSSGDNKITSLFINSGETNWKSSLNHHTPLRNRTFGLSEDLIVGSVLNRVIAWDVYTGAEKWNLTFEDSLTLSNLSGISLANEFFINVGTNGEIYRISLNGEREVEWLGIRSYESTYNEGSLYLTQRSPPSDDQLQYGVLQSLNSNKLELNWEFEKNGFGYATRIAPILENNILYVGTADGASGLKHGFFALNAQTGQEIWRREGILTFSAVLVDEYIYVNDAAGIYKLRKTDGEVEWHSIFHAGAGTAPIAYGYGYLYAPHSGTMHVVDAETGEIVHRFSPPDGSFFWRVTAGAGRIFAQSNRHLYAFAPWGHEEALE
jgi:outer membrane protein assembly factor BamB